MTPHMGRTLLLPSHIIVTQQIWHKLQRLAALGKRPRLRRRQNPCLPVAKETTITGTLFFSHVNESNTSRIYVQYTKYLSISGTRLLVTKMWYERMVEIDAIRAA